MKNILMCTWELSTEEESRKRKRRGASFEGGEWQLKKL